MTRARTALAAAGLSLSALLAGCGGGGDGGSPGQLVATPKIEGGTQVFTVVGTSSLQFSPKELRARPGTIRVDFSVEDGPPHNFVVDGVDGARTRILRPGEKASTTFTVTRPGSYPFVCTIHPSMNGTLEVT